MIIGIVLLAFLTSLAVQVPAIPEVSRGYPMVLLIISYAMTIWMLVGSVLKQKTGNSGDGAGKDHCSVLPYDYGLSVHDG